MTKPYTGKVAIVTGSSRGIGKAIAIEFAKNGASIVLNGRDLERLKDTEEIIRQYTSRVISVCTDVSTIEGGAALIDACIENFERIDFLINNVGVSMRGYVADLNPNVFKTVFDSNVLGTINPTIPALPYLRKTKGSLVFISSLAGIRGLPSLSAYCSSKMALRAIAESIRIEEAAHNLHVGLIYVGITAIEHNKETIESDGSKRVLQPRNQKNIHSTERVAQAVLKNIRRKKFISVLTSLGKLNAYLQPRYPLFVEKLILRNLDKFEERSQ